MPSRTYSAPAPLGDLHASRVIAEIGDCRTRCLIPEALASLVGGTPSTRQSRKVRTTSFR
ncbi:transposase [Pseudonocardia sp. CA-142604]|uniref:transposase n=1 Tax=Pseudonocardia sp. CA-142604 TaxID=3240024 RepID=UPI003D8E0364